MISRIYVELFRLAKRIFKASSYEPVAGMARLP